MEHVIRTRDLHTVWGQITEHAVAFFGPPTLCDCGARRRSHLERLTGLDIQAQPSLIVNYNIINNTCTSSNLSHVQPQTNQQHVNKLYNSDYLRWFISKKSNLKPHCSSKHNYTITSVKTNFQHCVCMPELILPRYTISR